MFLFKICDRIIEYSFYGLFLLVPLVFTSKTSELFELNKMWLTWGLTIIIAASWLIKMVLQRKIIFQKTPLDIPIGLFLISQIISTIFSWDSHTSLWGYYSRFNGGLLSIASYILLYYAFLSNLSNLGCLRKMLSLSLISGLIVALWGLPSHFGYDPTCLLFRGTLDVSCWTQDFMPKVRIFSTLGQPAWLAAYLAILIPIAIAFLLKNSKFEAPNPKQSQNSNSQIIKTFLNFGHWNLFRISIFVLLILFYVALLYTLARSGFLAIWIALAFLLGAYFWMQRKKSSIINHQSLTIIGIFLFISFAIGAPITQLNRFSLKEINNALQKITAPKDAAKPSPSPVPTQSFDSGGTESGDIRKFVWTGAISAWKANPIFGTGVETFAFAYYKYKPIGQNLTSEWNFLYNKAHNEYLNYLATTGIVGLGSYLLMIGYFLFVGMKALNSKHEAPNSKQHQNSNDNNSKRFEYSDFENSNLSRISNFEFRILLLALLASYISILITNFFGFSVVITNIYLFMIPAFIFVLIREKEVKHASIPTNKASKIESGTSIWQWTPIFFVLITALYSLFVLFRFWQADIAFALGYNLDRAGEYQQADPLLHQAVKLRGSEPVFKDELSINNAIIAAGLLASESEKTKEQNFSTASLLTQEAINVSNEIISKFPKNAVFWKTRVRLFYTLSQIDSRYLTRALDAIEKASILAPNDANIWYNLGVLYGQNNNIAKGIEVMEKTIRLKPDYRDAHYALGLFYRTASLDATGKIVADKNFNQKALAQMEYILNKISPQDTSALDSIKAWRQ